MCYKLIIVTRLMGIVEKKKVLWKKNLKEKRNEYALYLQIH